MNKLAQRLAILLTSLAIVVFTGRAQTAENPVSFTYGVQHVGGNIYEVKITARINKPWHIYSQYTPPEGPSLPTHISFSKNPLVEIVGKPEEKGKLITRHEDILDVNLKYFAEKVAFIQKVKVKQNVKTNLQGTIEYMACTNERCLMPATEKFSLDINK